MTMHSRHSREPPYQYIYILHGLAIYILQGPTRHERAEPPNHLRSAWRSGKGVVHHNYQYPASRKYLSAPGCVGTACLLAAVSLVSGESAAWSLRKSSKFSNTALVMA